MAKVFISLLVVLSVFASFGHALPSTKMFREVRLDDHLLSNATCEERKSYYINNRIQADWLTAELMCESFGFQQVTFNNQLEMNGLLDYLQTRFTNNTFWLGATNIDRNQLKFTAANHGYYWLSNEKKINFPMRWFAGEPNFANNEHCLQADFRNGIIGLNDNTCNRDMYFICEDNDCPKF
ncbi:unnamed protein product [Diamesa hyperborea]